jgi:hypothetical protein
MSVGFARAVADGLRHNGVPVIFEPGWETRGNGLVFPNGRAIGLIEHHTGSAYDTGLSVLIRGRSDLSPPLCNSCGHANGAVRIIAAHPANHAGAGGGRSMGPLPVTRSFNKLVWGHEIMYPGNSPMNPAQYRSAQVLSAVINGILGYRDNEHTRGHAETSPPGVGKWDPGYAPGRTIDMNAFRAGVPRALYTPAAPSRVLAEEDDELQNFIIGPGGLPLKGRITIGCPTGDLSITKRRAWLSATAVELRGKGWIRVFAQGSSAGVGDWGWTERELMSRPDHYIPRAWREVPKNTSHLVVSWDLSTCPEGGTVILETQPTV